MLKASLSLFLRRSATAVGLLTIAISAHCQNAPLFHFEPKPGSYGVGLKVVQQYDHSRVYHGATDALGRPYLGERARPLQTLIWYPSAAGAYPAETGTAKPMTVKDYVDLFPSETDFDHPQAWAGMQELIDGMKPTYSSPMMSVRDAKAASGRFPVVIYAPSFNAMSWENADLCEYLASHGYVVIATPDFGFRTRGMSMDDNLGAEAQAGDIEFLIGYAQTLSNTDMSKLAVAAYSWGGLANLFAAAKDNRIRAMAELDSTLRYRLGSVKDATYVHPDQMTIPMLYLSHGEMSMETLATRTAPAQIGPSVLNAWTHGDMIYVNMRGLIHGEFGSMSQRSESLWKSYPQNRIADYSREDGTVGYAWIARYVLAFMDSYLKGDVAGTTFLNNTPAENGAPEHFISVNFRRAKGIAPTVDSLKIEAGKQGFDHLGSIYGAMKKETPYFKPDTTEMGAWADDLIATGHLPEAIDVLKLNVEVSPDAYGVYIPLGDAYAQAGERDLAIQSYKTQLEKTPGNTAVAEKIKALSK
jgi:tetratricopeptide (TPR) repeat protein